MLTRLTNYLIISLLSLYPTTSIANAEVVCAGPICVKTIQKQDGVTFSISNNYPMLPVTVVFELNLDNMQFARGSSDPLILPGAVLDKEIFTLEPTKHSVKWEYQYKFKWYWGEYDSEPTIEYLYHLPFPAGISERVNQSCKGAFSHTGKSHYAIDFGLDEGDPISAARAGVVVDIVEINETGGVNRAFLDLANYITIQHADRTLATYSHLKKYGSLVEIGQTVRKGELIAFSGNTGYSSGPHLHFEVTKVTLEEGETSFPIEFATSGGTIICPAEGRLLTSVNIE